MISGYISESKERSPLTKIGDTGILIHEKAEFMNSLPLAYFTHLEDNSGFMAAGIGDAPKICSREWEAEKYKYFEASRPGIISYSRDGSRWEKVGGLKHAEGAFSGLFLCTRKGTLIYIYSDFSEAVFNWDKNKHDALDAALPVYESRSTDKAKTWEPVKKLHDHYTGECMDIIQTKTGRVVFTTMKLLNGPGRHSVMTYGSDDEGQTWQASNIIDLGGVGNHGGISEASMVELNDGRLLKYIRTNWGQFWIAISEDEGRYWHPYGPSGVDASSAPGALKRLSSGETRSNQEVYKLMSVFTYY